MELPPEPAGPPRRTVWGRGAGDEAGGTGQSVASPRSYGPYLEAIRAARGARTGSFLPPGGDFPPARTAGAGPPPPAELPVFGMGEGMQRGVERMTPEEEEELRANLTRRFLQSTGGDVVGSRTAGEGMRAGGAKELPPAPATEHMKPVSDEKLPFYLRGLDREGRINRLEAMRGMAEGLGRIRAVTGAQIRSGVNLPPPMLAEGIRGRIGKEETELEREKAMAEDVLSPEEAAWLKSQGIEIPAGLRASRVSKFLPAITAQKAAQARAAAAGGKKRAGGALSDLQVKDITNLDRALGTLYKIQALKPSAETGPDTGKLPALRHWAAEWMGVRDPDVAEFKQLIMTRVTDFLHDMSGAAITPQEAKRLMQVMPTMEDDDPVFMRKLQNVVSEAEDLREQTMKNLEAQGKDVGAIRGTAPRRARSSAGSGGRVAVYDPKTGEKAGEVWPDELEEARGRGAVTLEELRR